jgi:(1->4)-alpha-D-glucan 1-alpha-D-glucosylmutase
MPEEWAAHVGRWFEIGSRLLDGGAPDAIEQYFLFQTLVGAWPIEVERIESYMEKALREAKRNTTWVNPSPEWEEATKRFCRALLAEGTFMADFLPFVARVRAIGERAALGQLVLKLTSPGVPDIYQGDELPFRALVDPDNRRPIDWQWHQAMLSRLMGGSRPDGPTLKLWVTLRLLTLRARRPEPFLTGGYEPLAADEGTCAFVRAGDVLVVVALRDSARARFDGPRGHWHDVLRGGEWSFRRHQRVSDVVDEHGVGVFERTGP